MTIQKNGKSIGEQNSIDSLLLNANWDMAKQAIASNGKTIVYVPIIHSPIGIEYFYDNQHSKIDSGNIVRVVSLATSANSTQVKGVQAYYEKVVLQKDIPFEFNGSITAFSIYNKFLYDYTIWDNKIKSHSYISPNKNIGKSNIKSNSIKSNMECEPWGHFTVWSDGSVTLDYTYMVCNDECQSASIGIKNGTEYIRSNCGGGGAGASSDTSVLPMQVRVWNNVNDLCLNKVLNKVFSTVTSITSILAKNQFGDYGYFAINVHDSSLPMVNNKIRNGYTDPEITTGADGIRYINIYLNTQTLGYSSEEFVAKTIMHESLHALLITEGFSLKSVDQHNEIANVYIDDLSKSLKNLFSLSDDVAAALSWSGLDYIGLVDAWDNLPSSMRDIYSAIADDYWKGGTAGNRIFPGKCK
ncbi:MAG: hypothetical protein RLZ56_6 [Bacteroidota bacterium]|jgi:hypothetical protein